MVRVIVSDPEEGKAYQVEPEKSQFESLIGLRIGDQFDGEKIGLPGYELEITGGSDEEGFAMRADVRGRGRARALLSGGTGYNPPRKGERRRKTIRGNRISDRIVQLNTKITGQGQEPIEQLLGLETSVGESGKMGEVEKSGEETSEEESEEEKEKSTGG